MENKKRNKIIITVLIILIVLILLVVGYFLITYFNKQKSNIEEQEKVQYYEPTQEEILRAQELEGILKENLPKMDGSTSTIPLEAGIVSALFNTSQDIAEASVVHSTTYGSYYNLLDDKCDIIFSTPLSEEQYKMAKDKNIELVETPIVYEGFVFVVNAKNPVDTLSQQQLKDIYSGKITNWKEVGGNDAPIVAYQRNETSGSQNYMKAFMKDSVLMEPKTDFLPASMVGLMDAVATYDNAENAIGYSVYAYAADMYGNGNEIKFIKVDGVEPTKPTMASGEYPLLNYNYAIYNKVKETDTTVDELVEWILTYNGQVAMSKAGYIPVKNIKVEEDKIEPYTTLGTGKVKDKNREIDDIYYTAYSYLEDDKIIGLKDKELENKINKFIDESKQKLKDKENECKKYVDLLNKAEGHDYETYTVDDIRIETSCINGYLSVEVFLPYTYNVQSGDTFIYHGYSQIYDLYTSKELQLSDLYYKDVNFIEFINKRIEERIPYAIELAIQEIKTKRTFSSVPKDISVYGLETIVFTKNNPFFVEGVKFNIESYLEDISVIYEARDMKDIFEDNIEISKNLHRTYFNTNIDQKKEGDYTYNIYYSDSNDKQIDEYINNYIDNNYIDANKTKKIIDEYVIEHPEVNDILNDRIWNYEITIMTTMYGRKYMSIFAEWGFRLAYDSIVIDLDTKEILTEEEFENIRNSIEVYN